MKRRTFIAGLGSAAAWPVAARAQQSDQVRRIGVLMNGAAIGAEYHSYLAAFIQHLQQLEWTDGRNLHIDVRWNASDAVLAQTYAVELIGLTPDVILAASTINLIPVAQVTRTVPVVFVSVADPVAQGFVASVRQPGGNLGRDRLRARAAGPIDSPPSGIRPPRSGPLHSRFPSGPGETER